MRTPLHKVVNHPNLCSYMVIRPSHLALHCGLLRAHCGAQMGVPRLVPIAALFFLARAAATQTLGWGGSIINTSHPWYIVSTSTSRKSNEGLYLAAWWNAGQDSESVLRGWKFDYNNQDNRMAWWLWPAGGEADLFYLVATRDSRRPGQMVYLDIFGVPRLWPFHPDTSDPMAEWKLVPADLASGVVKSEDDMPAYFIVSGSNQRYKNEMLFVRGEVGGAPLPPPPPLTFAPSPPPLLPPPLSELKPTVAPVTPATARNPLL